MKEAAAVGTAVYTERMWEKMRHATSLAAALHGVTDMNWALGYCAVHGRLATGCCCCCR